MAVMSLGDALNYFRGVRQNIIDQKKQVISQRDALQQKAGETNAYADEMDTLELSLEGLNALEKENYKTLDDLTGQYAAIWNAEVARQQGDACQKMGEDMVKIMEVFRRIAHGDRVPACDEQKLMEYSSELYQAAKNMASLNAEKEHKNYDSLWSDEEEGETYDPEGKAENAKVDVNLTEIPAMEETVPQCDDF